MTYGCRNIPGISAVSDICAGAIGLKYYNSLIVRLSRSRGERWNTEKAKKIYIFDFGP